MTQEREDFIARLSTATAQLKVTCMALIKFAQAKQKVRAEPWQQTVIEMLQKAVTDFDRVIKEEETF